MRAVRALSLAIVVGALVPVLASSAGAADLGGRGSISSAAPVAMDVPPQFSWAGLYVGAHVGYGWSDIEWQDGAFAGSQDGEGLLAGGQLGYNLQTGRLVYGLEADVSASWIEGGTGCCGHAVEMLYSVRGRAGLASSDNRWLFYATGGAAWADIDYTSAGLGGGHSDTHFGWVAGGGIERALTSRLTARVEYLYYDFDSLSVPPGLGGGDTDLDPSMHTVRLGLNLKF